MDKFYQTVIHENRTELILNKLGFDVLYPGKGR